eukprot:m.37428 g.37428  ORF g.37428 m.37428 type:complete len:334 (+) comp5834_c0_seq2:1870-2871(+)
MPCLPEARAFSALPGLFGFLASTTPYPLLPVQLYVFCSQPSRVLLVLLLNQYIHTLPPILAVKSKKNRPSVLVPAGKAGLTTLGGLKRLGERLHDGAKCTVTTRHAPGLFVVNEALDAGELANAAAVEDPLEHVGNRLFAVLVCKKLEEAHVLLSVPTRGRRNAIYRRDAKGKQASAARSRQGCHSLLKVRGLPRLGKLPDCGCRRGRVGRKHRNPRLHDQNGHALRDDGADIGRAVNKILDKERNRAKVVWICVDPHKIEERRPRSCGVDIKALEMKLVMDMGGDVCVEVLPNIGARLFVLDCHPQRLEQLGQKVPPAPGRAHRVQVPLTTK